MELELLKLVIDASKSNYQIYLNNVWATLGFLILVVGWILTSKESRSFLFKHERLRKILIYALIALVVIHFAILIELYIKSGELIKTMQNMDLVRTGKIKESFLTYYKIPFYWLIGDFISNSILLAVAITLFSYLKKPESLP